MNDRKSKLITCLCLAFTLLASGYLWHAATQPPPAPRLELPPMPATPVPAPPAAGQAPGIAGGGSRQQGASRGGDAKLPPGKTRRHP
jgi:hypothetical protein